jgi:hypothetical protein
MKMSKTLATDWWSGAYQIERKCTCGNRGAECLQIGWHVVDSNANQLAAQIETRRCAKSVPGVLYRTIDARNRSVIETLCFSPEPS